MKHNSYNSKKSINNKVEVTRADKGVPQINGRLGTTIDETIEDYWGRGLLKTIGDVVT